MRAGNCRSYAPGPTFDHTSVLATVGKMTNVGVDSPRTRQATSLSVTLDRMMPRTDAAKLTFRRGAANLVGG